MRSKLENYRWGSYTIQPLQQ